MRRTLSLLLLAGLHCTCAKTPPSVNVSPPAAGTELCDPTGRSEDPSVQIETYGVDFAPWTRRFVAQVRRNWFIPLAAGSQRGCVVLTVVVWKDGRITDVKITKASPVESFNSSALHALTASNPTVPLPEEFPEKNTRMTATFYFNVTPK